MTENFFDTVFDNNREWVAQKLATDPHFFENLSLGQNPEVLYIGCSDSRVTAEELMGAGPGQVFVHRNIANIVAPTDLSALSVIDYAVTHLGVKRIVVCGHYGCGGVHAAMKPLDLGVLNPWLRNIRDVYRTHVNELKGIDDPELRHRRLVELNIEEQCLNVTKIAAVQRSFLNQGYPTVHGLVFDMKTGELIDLKINFTEKLDGIREIYDLGTFVKPTG